MVNKQQAKEALDTLWNAIAKSKRVNKVEIAMDTLYQLVEQVFGGGEHYHDSLTVIVAGLQEQKDVIEQTLHQIEAIRSRTAPSASVTSPLESNDNDQQGSSEKSNANTKKSLSATKPLGAKELLQKLQNKVEEESETQPPPKEISKAGLPQNLFQELVAELPAGAFSVYPAPDSDTVCIDARYSENSPEGKTIQRIVNRQIESQRINILFNSD